MKKKFRKQTKNKNFILLFIIFNFVAFFTGNVVFAQSANYYKMGINIGSPTEDRDFAFVDVAKTSRIWENMTSTWPPQFAITDANGWPLEDAKTVLFDVRPVPVWLCSTNWQSCGDDPELHFPDIQGTYKCSFIGSANINNIGGIANASAWTIENKVYDSGLNKTTFDLVIPQGTALVQMSFTNTNGGIKDLHVIRPGYNPDSHPTFTNSFLNALEKFSVIRTMQFTNTNHNTLDKAYPGQVEWNERTKTTSATQATGGGVAWEYIIELANTANRDVWISVPISASDNYITQLAQLFKNNLSSGLTVYVEHSNEVWNSIFASTFSETYGKVLNGQNTYAFDAGNATVGFWEWQGKRIGEISQIFQNVFGQSEFSNRFKIVMSGQADASAVQYNVQSEIDYINTNIGPFNQYVSGLALAPYIGGGEGNNGSVAQILQELSTYIPAAMTINNQYKAKADLYGIETYWYESGQHYEGTTNTANKILANRDAGIQSIYENYYQQGIDNGVDIMGVFDLCKAYSRYGSFGLTWDITNLNTPKFNAIHDLVPVGKPITNGTPTTYTLSISSTDGSVTKSPDKTSYNAGETVTLTATSNLGYQFDNWSGDATGATNPITVTMDSNKSVTANFSQTSGTTYTLSVNATNGSVTKSPDKTSYDDGETVTLTATANSGYQFDNWSGDATGTTNSVTITMNSNKSVTANFSAPPPSSSYKFLKVTIPNAQEIAEIDWLVGSTEYPLTHLDWNSQALAIPDASYSSYDGDVTWGANQTEFGIELSTAISPSKVKIHKTPWASITSFKCYGANSEAGPWTLLLDISSATFTNDIAEYDIGGTQPTTYTLSVNATNGLVTKSPDKASYNAGETVALTATANSGYQFDNWSGDATGTTNSVTITMNSNKSVTANFSQISATTYTLSVNATNGSVTKSPDKTSYDDGETVTLTATANSGYQFDNWSGDATGTTNSVTITMNSNKSVTANFSAPPPSSSYKFLKVTIPNAQEIAEIDWLVGSTEYPLTHLDWNSQALAIPDASYSSYDGDVTWGANQTEFGIELSTAISPSKVKIHKTPWASITSFKCYGANSEAGPWTLLLDISSATFTNDIAEYDILGGTTPPTTYTLSINTINGSVTKSPDKASYNAGETVALTANPNANYSFTGWSGDVSGTSNSVNVTINSNLNITANYQYNGPTTSSNMVVGVNFWSNADWSTEEQFITNVDFAAAWNSGKTNGLVNTNVWNSTFLDDIQYFKVLRPMEWGIINNSKVSQWSERRLPTDSDNDNTGWIGADDGLRAGMAYEWMIDLANRTGKDLWINVPHLTTEDYWTNLAQLLYDNLNSSVKVYIEYSNEVWNGAFTENAYSIQQGQTLGLNSYTNPFNEQETDNFSGGHRFNAYMAVRLFKAFESVFGVNNPRLVKVLGGWTWHTYMTQLMMDVFDDVTLNPTGVTADALAVAPYIGNNLDGNDSDFWNKIRNGYLDGQWEGSSLKKITSDLKNQKALCDAKNWKLIAYEAGQHVTLNSVNVNEDPLMYDLYTEYLDSVSQYLDECMIYAMVTNYSANAFGIKQYTGQPIANAHKYRAIFDWVNTTTTLKLSTKENTIISKNLFSFYPNPVSTGKLNIIVNSLNYGKNEILLYDINGRIVLKENLFENKSLIDISSLKSGMYFITVKSGNIKESKKLIIN